MSFKMLDELDKRKRRIELLERKLLNERKQGALEELKWVIDHLHCQEDIEEIEKHLRELKEGV